MGSQTRIILTRQRERNQVWHQRLAEAGVNVSDLPLLHFSPIEAPADCQTDTFDWILFTSPQGVDAFVAANLNSGQAKLGALGAGTSEALQAVGLSDDLGFKGRDGRELADAFIKKVNLPASVLLPGAANRLPDPRVTLNAAGFQVRELPLYETLSVSPENLVLDFLPNDLIFFCSPSAVRAFVAAFAERPACVAIGETTAALCRDHGFSTRVADTPDLDAMVRAAGCEPLTTLPEKKS